MARTCELCGRGSLKSMTRSHSHIGTIKRQKVNLQTMLKDGKCVLACAKCIRTATKQMKQAVAKTSGK